MIDVLAAASALHNEQEVAQQMFYTNGQLLISNFVITTVTVICLFLMESLVLKHLWSATSQIRGL